MAARTASPVVAASAAAARGIVGGDGGSVAEAASTLREHGRAPEAARAAHAAAVLIAAGGDRAGGRAVAAEAFAAYEVLGAARWRHELVADLREVGVPTRPRRSAPRPTSGWGSLTPSEAAVVDLVGEGLTNTAVAARLCVSRRTVESHLARVYAKVGLRSRSELIAEVARRAVTLS